MAELLEIKNESYHSYKPDNRYPVVVINIDVDPSLIDVNIHPTKMDIKFSKMEVLLELVSDLIKQNLHTINHTPKIEASDIKKIKVEQLNIDLNLENSKVKEYDDAIINNYEINEVTESKPLIDDFYIENDQSLIKNETSKEEIKEKEETETKRKFKQLYPVGIVHATYIVCQNEDGMTLIDQHAAKERCNYELFKKQMGNPNNDSIRPLIPLTFEFPTNEFIILKEHFDILRNIGFEIEEFGISSVIVKRHPTWLPSGYENDAIRRILESVISFEKDFTIEKFNEKVATTLSCKMAIKANDYIDLNEANKLLEDLEHCENPFHCPHGRPTMINFSKAELEKLFKRSGF
jgi:DNA mismatch repair protein MutL